MRYYITLGGRERTVDLEPLGGSRYSVAIDGGEPRDVDAARLEGSVVNMVVGHASWDVDFEEDGEALNVLVDEEVMRVEVLDDRRKRLKAARGGGAAEGTFLLRAPMPGKVVKVLVKPGDAVEAGAGLVIIEAMKMENELRAPRAGTVSAVHVAEGTTVEGKAELLTVV